jgi:hypothetical protein
MGGGRSRSGAEADQWRRQISGGGRSRAEAEAGPRGLYRGRSGAGKVAEAEADAATRKRLTMDQGLC